MTQYFRKFDVEARANGDGIACSLSSEYPVDRAWGREVLLHSDDAIDLSRAPLPLIESHDTGKLPVGVIDNLHVSGRRLRGTIRFGNSARAQELKADALGGIIRSLSIGYQILKTEPSGNDVRVTRWAPYEGSLVSIPADPTVGIGRTFDIQGRNIMEQQTDTQDASRSQRRAENRAMSDERERVNDILAIGRNYNLAALAADAVQDGISVADFQQRCIDALSSKAKPTADIGFGQFGSESRAFGTRDLKGYSLLKAVHAAATGDWSRAGLEREVSREMERTSGRAPRSLFVPLEALGAQQRDLTVGNAGMGGNLVETVMPGFIDMLRRRSVVLNMAQWLPGLVGNVELPRQTGASTASWVAESGAPTESMLAFDKIAMSPKTVGAFVDISRKLMLQSSQPIEQIVRQDLAAQITDAIEAAALNGTGLNNQPLGLLKASGTSSVPIGTNGGAPTWAHLVAMETALINSFADDARLAYVTNGAVRGKLRTTETVSGSGEFIWQGSTAPGEGSIAGYRAVTAAAMPGNLTKGSGTNLSAIAFGNFNDLLIGQWGGLDLLVDPYSQSSSGTVRVVAFMDVDVGIRHPESFSIISDAATV